MQCNGEIDSGRSSCSAGSCGVAMMLRDVPANASNDVRNKLLVTREAATNTELCVSLRPRSCVGLLSSPSESDPFPVNRTRRNTLQNLFDTPRKVGLNEAHSTNNIASSTRIELVPTDKQNVVITNTGVLEKTQFKRSRPVQRAASRLYSVSNSKLISKTCIGPEFIVRASQPVEKVDLTTAIDGEKRAITIVLLTGQRIEITVDPSNTTVGQIFELIVKREKYDHNFMLGLAVLAGGDFIFLPDDYKVRKVAPEGWYKQTKKTKDVRLYSSFTVFLRIKFFLPTNIAKNIQGGEWRYRVYLQLRRSTLEGQLTTSLQNLILLSSYALHIEFGDFCYRDHGSGDYFLLEHYLPEGYFSIDVSELKLRLKRAHESRRGMDRERAIVNYIVLAQSCRDYGAHFYSAVWATRDGFCRDVWLSIGPKGITLYSRNTCIATLPKESHNGNLTNRIVLQSLAWHHIHNLQYNKKSLYIVPNSRSGISKTGTKYKIKMDDNKSSFIFWLASLHHRLYLKLHAKQEFIDYMSDEQSYPVSPMSSEGDNFECSNYKDSYNMAVRNQHKVQQRQIRKRFRMDIFAQNPQKNKENDKPDSQKLLQELMSSQLERTNLDDSVNSILSKPTCSSNEGLSSSESCSLPRRQGVKMGTRAFHGMKLSATASKTDLSVRSDGEILATHSDSDDLSLEPKHQINSMRLLQNRNYKDECYTSGPTAYVIESPKVYNSYSYNHIIDNTAANNSLIEKLDSENCVQGERCFVTSVIMRDSTGTLGMQVAEGSDGNVYIKSITPNGPTDLVKKLIPGDQIISVNGHTLLNMPYTKALSMLQSAPHRVELIVLQSSNGNSTAINEKTNIQSGLSSQSKKTGSTMTDDELHLCTESISSELNELAMIDHKIINEDALKTIHALIKLTKQNLITKITDQSYMNTPNKLLMQKCLSENKIYDESDTGNYSSQENTPQKKAAQHLDSWRVRNQVKTKRRPMSLHISSNIELGEKFFTDFENDEATRNVNIMEKASLKRVETSLKNLGEKLLSEEIAGKNVAVPRNFGLSRKWLGPVKYPVTPLKETSDLVSNTVKAKNSVVKKHFVYSASSDDEQLFL